MKVQLQRRYDVMLLQFRFRNFKSFADEVVLDMMATNIKEHNNSLICVNGNNILPLAAIYGANASGKSNVFKAFNAMCTDVACIYNKNEKHTNISTFIFDGKLKDEPLELEVSININNKEYRYGFLRNQTAVFEEWLYERKFAKNTRAKEKCIFYRNRSKVSMDPISKKEEKEIRYIHSMIDKGELIITALGRRDKSIYSEIYQWFNITAQLQDFSDDYDELRSTEFAADFLYENDNLLEDVTQLLRTFDSAIVGLKIEKEKDEELNEINEVYSYHLNEKNEEVKLPFASESSGTKKIFSLATWLMFSINSGLVLFVDELDAKLHPLALRYLIGLYSNKKTNIANGQLIFSSHNLVSLDSADLRRDEIWFVEKNKQKSTMFSLYDFKEDDDSCVRPDLNFGKNYLSGRFGAIPFLEQEE
jgi:AAA15 family ATPase/GTPase